MTVKELIEKLKEYDLELEIWSSGDESGFPQKSEVVHYWYDDKLLIC